MQSHPHDVALTRPLLLAAGERERAGLLESHLTTLAFLADSTSRSNQNPFYSNPDDRRERTEASAIIGDAAECIERLSDFVETRHSSSPIYPHLARSASPICRRGDAGVR